LRVFARSLANVRRLAIERELIGEQVTMATRVEGVSA
jgi:hypothetical protein